MAPQRKIRIAIVGGGISGIAQAVRLQEALGNKKAEVTIYERSNEAGGVWRDSRWAGAAVDVPIHLYCLYSHLNPDFSAHWAGRDEVLAYWKRIIAKHRLGDRFVFNVEFVGSRWNSLSQTHTVTFRRVESGETYEVEADVLISATGALNRPIIPNVPGRDDFQGLQWHSSRWNTDVDLQGKKIAIVGNGSSGIQVIPNIADLEGIEIVQFVRSPGYFRPKHNFEYSRLQRFIFRYIPFALRLYRWKIFYDYDYTILSRGTGTFASDLREKLSQNVIEYMKKTMPDEYHDALIPKYPMHCKRVAYDGGWLASLNKPNVSLTASPIMRVTPNGLETADGKHFDVDIIVWATGFEVSETGVGLNHNVLGEDGKELRAIWKERNGAFGYQGIAAPNVPNYFIVLGPNAIAQSWGYTLGHNTEHIARIIRGMYDQSLSSIMVKDSVMDSYNQFIGNRLAQTSLSSAQCGTSWYKDPVTGKVVAPAPWGATELWTYTRKIRWEHWLCRRWSAADPSNPDRKAVVVEVKSPRTWTPWGLFIDWLALRIRKRLVRLMIEVKPGRQAGAGKAVGGEASTPLLADPEEYLA
ncbi:hypothetical protein JCM3774_002125 [Rhodotorula dairenensis]